MSSAPYARHAAPSGEGAARRTVVLAEPLPLFRGGVLEHVEIAYETWGELTPNRDNVVVLYTGLSPGPHASSSTADPSPGWWEHMVGAGKPIDTERFFVICINSLGSCFGSTGPASTNPATHEAYGLDFPELTVEDIAAAGRLALHQLGLDRPLTVIGASLGGMTALAHAVLYPTEVRHMVLISTATQARPLAIAIRSLQREIIRSDPAWRNGRYVAGTGPVTGMRLARKLGLISYRSDEEWSERFARARIPESSDWNEPFEPEFQIESYLEHHAQKFIRNFDANCYLYMSRAMDWFDLSHHGGSIERALATIQAERTLVIGVESDFLFPLEQQREIATILEQQGRAVDFVALPSPQGHDAFLADGERFCPVISRFFDDL